jgi:hypothetical protein
MMMRTCLGIMCLAILIGSGCAATDRPHKAGPCISNPKADRHAELAAALLFDRRPGPYDASDFAFRSEWPSTLSFYSPGEVMLYQEQFYDFQGGPFGTPSYTYQYSNSYRVNVGYR